MLVLILNILFICLSICIQQPFEDHPSILYNVLHLGCVILLYLAVNYSMTPTIKTTSTATDPYDDSTPTTTDGTPPALIACKCKKSSAKFRDVGTATCLDKAPYVPPAARPRGFIEHENPFRHHDKSAQFIPPTNRTREFLESFTSSNPMAANFVPNSDTTKAYYQVYIPYRYFLTTAHPASEATKSSNSSTESQPESATTTTTTPLIFLNGVVQSTFANIDLTPGAMPIIFLPSTEPRVRLVPPESQASQPTRETRPGRSKLYDYYVFNSEPLDKKLDLRLRYLSDAMTAFFEFYIRMGGMYVNEGYKEEDRYIYVVTGYGKYSENGIGVIKQEVQSFLDDNSVRHRWLNRGLVMIDFCDEDEEVRASKSKGDAQGAGRSDSKGTEQGCDTDDDESDDQDKENDDNDEGDGQ